MAIYVLSRGRADSYADALAQYAFKLPFLASLGLYIGARIPYNFKTRYDLTVRAKISELFNHLDSNAVFRIHIAQKVVLVVTSLIALNLVALIGDAKPSFYIFGLVTAALVYYGADRDLDKKIRNRKRDILVCLPGLINNIAILVNAGLPLTAAIQKVVRDAGPGRPLYRELSYMLVDISAGKPVNRAYEDLARRCRMLEITRLVSTILQNLNLGSSDLVYVLRILAQEAWEKRKEVAKKQGEEAAAKLVFPMVMVFAAVSLIVIAPAVMTMSM